MNMKDLKVNWKSYNNLPMRDLVYTTESSEKQQIQPIPVIHEVMMRSSEHAKHLELVFERLRNAGL